MVRKLLAAVEVVTITLLFGCSGSTGPVAGTGGKTSNQTTGGSTSVSGASALGGSTGNVAGSTSSGGIGAGGTSPASCPSQPPMANDLCDISLASGTGCNYANQCFACQCISNQPGVTCRYAITDCPSSQCVAAQGSCAQGETCCAGLTCCAGVPVPQGSEYCGTTCPRSDQALKRGFASVDQREVLDHLVQLPIATWSYKTEGTQVKHLGPMAQDFKAAFGLGESDRTILQVDADGVAFAAIQALHARLTDLEATNRSLLNRVQQLEFEAHQCRETSPVGAHVR
jgi:hypothetical protein